MIHPKNIYKSGTINGIPFGSYTNVWFALEANEAEAINLTFRSELLNAIQDEVKSWNLSQQEAAKKLGITRPRLSDLLRGKINKFSLDMLTTLAHNAGLTVKMSVKKTVLKRAA
jgi:predicted XRE-type DNA-binding protein